MSQSPLVSQSSNNNEDYLDGWNRLANLIREGHSFSGHERNCAFLNLGDNVKTGTRFSDVSACLNVDVPDDSRGLAVTDWDQDGDLDFWLANRTGPRVRLMLNPCNDDQSASKSFVALQLVGVSCNRDAIGARVELATANGAKSQYRTVRAGDGFLSQSSRVLHFGLDASDPIVRVRVRWPGTSEYQTFDSIQAGHRYRLVQGKAGAQPSSVAA